MARNVCGIEATCQVGYAWQRVNLAIRSALGEVTLAQLAGLERGGWLTPDLSAGLATDAAVSLPARRSPAE
jgi:DNA-binding IscR family transcriptional regulator